MARQRSRVNGQAQDFSPAQAVQSMRDPVRVIDSIDWDTLFIAAAQSGSFAAQLVREAKMEYFELATEGKYLVFLEAIRQLQLQSPGEPLNEFAVRDMCFRLGQTTTWQMNASEQLALVREDKEGIVTNAFAAQPIQVAYAQSILRQIANARGVMKPIRDLLAMHTKPGAVPHIAELLHDLAEHAAQIERIGTPRLQGQFLSGTDLMTRDAQLQFLIPGVLIKQQLHVVGGPTKAMKTGLNCELGIALTSTNREGLFLGRFPVPMDNRGVVLMIASESTEAACRARLLSVARERGLLAIPERLKVLPGQTVALGNPADRQDLLDEIVRQSAVLVSIDPNTMNLFNGLPKDSKIETSDVSGVSQYVERLAREVHETGCTLSLTAHSNKAAMMKYEPMELAELTGAGVHEAMRQWILVRRRERFNPETGVNKLFVDIGASDGFSHALAVDVNEGTWSPQRARDWIVTVRTQAELRLEARDAAVGENVELVRAVLQAQPVALGGLAVNAIRTSLRAAGNGRSDAKIREALGQLAHNVTQLPDGKWVLTERLSSPEGIPHA